MPPRRRVDAQRNREAILHAAQEVFEEQGVLAPLDVIAVRAGIGNATLYRNFPTRDELLVAVAAASIDEALAAADELAALHPPGEALAAWLVHLAWNLRIWHDLPTCVASAKHDPDGPLTAAYDPLAATTGRLLAAAQGAGRASLDVTGDELFELVTTLSWGIDRYGDDEPGAMRRVRIGTAGIFTPAVLP